MSSARRQAAFSTLADVESSSRDSPDPLLQQPVAPLGAPSAQRGILACTNETPCPEQPGSLRAAPVGSAERRRLAVRVRISRLRKPPSPRRIPA